MQRIGKEVKIGLAVIGVLLVAFGYVLVKRLSRPGDSIPSSDSPAAGAAISGPSSGSPAATKPTVVTATDEAHPGDSAAHGNRSRWAIGGRSAEASDARNEEPRDIKNPFATTSHELVSADSRGSIFTQNASTPEAPQTLPDSARRHGSRDEAEGDASGRAAAVQASDNAPATTATDQGAPIRPNSIFAKAVGEKGNDDKGGWDKPAANNGAENGAADHAASRNPFDRHGDTTSASAKVDNRDPADSVSSSDASSRRAADGGAAPNAFDRQANDLPSHSNPFDRRSGDSGPLPETLPRKSADDGRGADRPLVDRQSPGASSLTPIETPPLRSIAVTDGAPGSGNPLRDSANADARTTGGAGEPAGRFANPNRSLFTDSHGSSSAVGPRDGGSVAPARIFESGAANSSSQPLVGDEAPKPGQYVVQPNDSYYTISQRVYGDGGFFKAIYEHNRRQHPKPERLQVGDVLLVPDAATLQKLYPDLCPKPGRVAVSQRVTPASARIRPGTKVYVVEEGDTLFKIAKDQLGNPSRWGEVYQLNRDLLGKDYDYLKPGSELLIPTNENRSDPIARQPGATVN